MSLNPYAPPTTPIQDSRQTIFSSSLRLLAIPFIAVATFFIYTYAVDFTFGLVDKRAVRFFYEDLGLPKPWIKTSVILSMVIPYFLTVSGLSWAFAKLAAKVYRQHAIWIAIISAIPVVLGRAHELLEPKEFATFGSIAVYAVSAFEIVSFALLLCGGTWLTTRKLTPPSTTAV